MDNSYWVEAVSEGFEAIGIQATSEQISIMASWMKLAHECHSEYSAPVDRGKNETKACDAPQQQEWWRDRNQLSGADWVLANRIHDLINSRYV